MRNTTHLAKSSNAPFTSRELGEAIGLDKENEAVEQILNGTFGRWIRIRQIISQLYN